MAITSKSRMKPAAGVLARIEPRRESLKCNIMLLKCGKYESGA